MNLTLRDKRQYRYRWEPGRQVHGNEAVVIKVIEIGIGEEPNELPNFSSLKCKEKDKVEWATMCARAFCTAGTMESRACFTLYS